MGARTPADSCFATGNLRLHHGRGQEAAFQGDATGITTATVASGDTDNYQGLQPYCGGQTGHSEELPWYFCGTSRSCDLESIC